MPGYVDETGFDVDDPRHPRWCHPVKPDDGSEPMLDAVAPLGVPVTVWPTLLLVKCYWVARYPDAKGMYGKPAVSPQYTIRRDCGRRSLHETVESLRRLLR